MSIEAEDRVWEIGPGLGAITTLLLDNPAQVFAFEIDGGFVSILNETFADREGLVVVNGDFSDTWPEVFRSLGTPDRIVGNLPYRSAASMLAGLVRGGCIPKRIVCTVQREVAQRIVAAVGSADYSGFSLICQAAWQPRVVGDLKPGSFYPPPGIVSTIVDLVPRKPACIKNSQFFVRTVRELFAARRKTVRNNLSRGTLLLGVEAARLEGIITRAEIDPESRPETLDAKAVARLANHIEEHVSNSTSAL